MFHSLEQYYKGSWRTENSSQAYTLAKLVVAALKQSTLKEYVLQKSKGKVGCDSVLFLEKGGVQIPISLIRAQYIIGDDLEKTYDRGDKMKAYVDKILGRK